ncbi:hypothetical protein ACFLXL_00400 [Chloroflexota bacterium]
MWWVIIALACLLLLILLTLCIPIDLVISVDTRQNPKYKVRLLWLFGLIDWQFKKAAKKPETQPQVTSKQKQRRRIGTRTVYRIFRTKGLWLQLKHLIVGIYKSLKVKELTAHLKLGLESPVDTGILFAIAGPVNYLLSLLPHKIKIWPVFDSDIVFEAYGNGTARLCPALVMITLLKFIFSLPSLRVARIFVGSKWKRAQ